MGRMTSNAGHPPFYEKVVVDAVARQRSICSARRLRIRGLPSAHSYVRYVCALLWRFHVEPFLKVHNWVAVLAATLMKPLLVPIVHAPLTSSGDSDDRSHSTCQDVHCSHAW